MKDMGFMITRPRWWGLSVASLTLALVVAVCGIAPAQEAAATARGCEMGKILESVSGNVQAAEAPAALPCSGREVPRPTAIGLLPPSADAEVPASPLSEEVSSRAPPVSL